MSRYKGVGLSCPSTTPSLFVFICRIESRRSKRTPPSQKAPSPGPGLSFFHAAPFSFQHHQTRRVTHIILQHIARLRDHSLDITRFTAKNTECDIGKRQALQFKRETRASYTATQHYLAACQSTDSIE